MRFVSNLQAEEILQASVDDDGCLDQWTAVRCLAYYGECDSRIVLVILDRLFTRHGQCTQLDAAEHLISLSQQSVCPHD